MIGKEESIPTRSSAGLAARDVFYEQFNTVNFYIEDEDEENLYLAILERLFPTIRITQIFPLRGKPNVLAHADDPVNSSRAAKSVYILDKDFDDLLGHIVTRPNIFYLDRYCIENYVCEEDAVVQFAIECEPKERRDALTKKIDYPAYHIKIVELLDPLFRLFFAVQRFNLGLKNCDLKPEQFSIGGQPWHIDPSKIAAYEQAVLAKIRETGVFAKDEDFAQFLANAFPKQITPDANISGKFILALTFHYLRRKCSAGNVTIESLRYRLARNGALKSIRPLGFRILGYLQKSLALPPAPVSATPSPPN